MATSDRTTTHDRRNAAQRRSVLVIDDDVELGTLLELRLAAGGYDVTVALTAREGEALLSRRTFDVLLLDLRLADADGLQVLSDVRARAPDLPVIILSAHGTIELAVEATRRGAFGFVTKPFHDHDLLQRLAQAVETVSLRRELDELKRRSRSGRGDLIAGSSDAIKQVRELIARVAATDVTVLLQGESGTGKGLAARSLHAQSHRRAEPFVAVSCAAMPPEFLENELFGWVRGAFSGADRDRDGLFAAANGGTLFLDEIGDASPAVQAKLLHVLQQRSYTRAGSEVEVAVDVRVIAATNRDLQADVAAGRFRRDLFYRLHVLPIRMPPLRERTEDVPMLAELFLEHAAERHGRSLPRLTVSAVDVLSRHVWPGNVRELANVIEGALLLGEGNLLDAEQLRALMTPANAEGRVPDETPLALLPGEADEVWPTLRDVRDRVERAYLERVLRRTNGNVTAAARVAGRTRSDFYEVLRRHGLTSAAFKAMT